MFDRRTTLILLAMIAALPTGGALATATGQNQAFARWRIQDRCIAQSIKSHPDRNIASQQLRDEDVDKCLAASNLPPRTHMAPSDPAPADGKPAAQPPQP